jgi:hypothetical protein
MRDQDRPDELAGLWEAYRLATPAPDPSVNFMPELWLRIDAARPTSWVLPLTRWAYRLVPAVLAVTLALGIFAWPGSQSIADNLQVGYVDVLAADLLADQHPAHWVAGAEEGGLR